MMMKSYRSIGSLLLILFFLSSCKEKEAETQEVLRPVKFTEVSFLGGEKIRQFSGTAKTEKIINLSFRSSGIITKFDLKLGQKVKKNELLGALDNVSARLSYESAIETQNSSASQMNTAKLNLNRIRSLFEKGSASLSDYEAAKNSYKTAVASFESSKRSVAIQKDKIQYGYLYAPEDGVIASVSAEIDENISPGQLVGVLNAGSSIEIGLGLPESVINSVSKGMEVSVEFSAIENTKFNAVVTEVAPAINLNNSTYPITVMVTENDERIKSGMAATIIFEFANKYQGDKILVVPANAVGEDADGRFVFVIKEAGKTATVEKQKVTLGELTANGFEVLAGITVGQKIVTAGLQTLLDGQQVKLN
jgi:RND family efflux transporter MFP subunit